MKHFLLHIVLFTCCNICNAQWVKLSTDTIHYYSTVHFLNSDTGFVAGVDWYNSNFEGIILRTFDGGDNWDTTRISPGFWIMSIQFVNDTLGFAVGQDGIISKTTNTGDSWFHSGACVVPLDVSQFWYLNPDTAFFQNFGGNILRSNSWSIDSTCFPAGYNGFNSYFPGTGALRFYNSQNGYIAGGNGHFSRTSDGGNTWQAFNADSSLAILSGWMTNYNHVVLVGNGGKVSVSPDGGVTWSSTASISAHPILDVMMRDSLFGYAVGGADKHYYGPANLAPRGIIWKTNDGGYSWNVEDSSWFDQLTSVDIVNDSLTFAVGYRGLILRNTTLLLSEPYNPQSSFANIEVYPNPFNSFINISNQSFGILEMKLYDIASKLVFKKSIIDNTTIFTDKLQPGAYFYNLSNQNGILSKGKLVKIN